MISSAPRNLTNSVFWGEVVAIVVRSARRANWRAQMPTAPEAPLMRMRGFDPLDVGRDVLRVGSLN